MTHLHILTEGPTEQKFVKKILAPYLAIHEVYADARSVLTSKDKRAGRVYRGGMSTYLKARNDLIDWLKEDQRDQCYFSTMFDFYALPVDFPGYDKAQSIRDPYKKIAHLEEAFGRDIGSTRFLPYIQLHEFEALIFADPNKLDWEYLEHDQAIEELCAIAREQEPELINAHSDTAPSKRILQRIPEYKKTTGIEVVTQIGLPKLQERCPHFNSWVSKLTALTPGSM